MAKRRKGRAINGILLLDKETGQSSNHAMIVVRAIFKAQKAGHTGALDPLATGMLPICLGEATKFSQFLLDSDKTYFVTAKLGERTDTSDADGEVVEVRDVNVSPEQLAKEVAKFKGETQQIPSMFSALKYQGKPLYFYARQGIEVPRESRPIHVFSITVERFEGNEVDMIVHCSKGTYIRTIVDDLGEALGCGAHVKVLRRTAVQNYPSENMLTLSELEKLAHSEEGFSAIDELLLPMDSAVSKLAKVVLETDLAEKQFQQGQVVQIAPIETIAPNQDFVRVYRNDTFLGVASLQNGNKVQPKRVVNYLDS